MSATPAPEVEAHETLANALDDENAVSVFNDHDDDTVQVLQRPNDAHTLLRSTMPAVKSEDGDDLIGEAATTAPSPAPTTSTKHESETLPLSNEYTSKMTKKRKRAVSPPWQFPVADTTTLHTSDGRRASARVNPGTPQVPAGNEVSGRGRSVSQPGPRSRASSPPWKKFAAEGPSSIKVDGVRKSGRVNKELADTPSRPTPKSKFGGKIAKSGDKSQDRSRRPTFPALTGNTPKHSIPTKPPLSSAKTKPDLSKVEPTASRSEQLPDTPAIQPKRRGRPPKNANRDVTHLPKVVSQTCVPGRRSHRLSHGSPPPETSKPTTPKIKLRLSTPRFTVPAPHPSATAPTLIRPPRLSVFQALKTLEEKEMQLPFLENAKETPDPAFFLQRATKQAVEEAAMRQRIVKAAAPGGILSADQLSLYKHDPQPEPPAQHGHWDHLVAHALYLRQLQIREKTHHRMLAKKLAYEAVEYWKALHGPTEEDIILEQRKIIELVRKQVVADVKAKWDLVAAHVLDQKRLRWEAEQEKIRARKLQKQLEWSENLLAKQRGEAESEVDLDEDSTGDVNDSENGDDDDRSQDSDDNMSGSEEESADEQSEEEGEMDEDTLAAYLAQRKSESPDDIEMIDNDESQNESDEENDRPHDAHGVDTLLDGAASGVVQQAPMIAVSGSDGNKHDHSSPAEEAERSVKPLVTEEDADDSSEREAPRRIRGRGQDNLSSLYTKEEAEADDHLSSDESTDMDSESYDSDEDMSSTGNEQHESDDEEAPASDQDISAKDSNAMRNSLLAFYSPKDLLREREGGLPTPNTSVENGGDSENPRSNSEAASDGVVEAGSPGAARSQGMPEDTAVEKQDMPQNESRAADSHLLAATTMEDLPMAESPPTEDFLAKSFIEAPTMLRGQLRSYQLAGLNWLASLYRNGTNGILADEMGLGKTIQTISLLAHLAEAHEIWEPHLVIVPTSVILNWVTEFQKFLPGFRVLGYYGTIEERHTKRRGWANDPHHENKTLRGYNVIVTSYNVAMQDINAIRNVQWHYLILDEAHNIRNFNSQRWQTLIRLRTRARLLLTGTPLQNNLSEVWALLTFLTAGDDDRSHGELEEFLGNWKDPVKEIFDQGVQKLSSQAQRVVEQLHVSLRPFLLRRKKIEVEKDLPKKTESVVVCKLSKRQRQLYQDYMGLAETRAALAKGSGIQAGAVLLSLRRVCNHPDLFDPRPIQTSFAMEKSALESYHVEEKLVRDLLGVYEHIPDAFRLLKAEGRRKLALDRSRKLAASHILQKEVTELEKVNFDPDTDITTISGSRIFQRHRQRERRLGQLRACIQTTETSLRDRPVYGSDLRELFTIHRGNAYVFNARQHLPLKGVHAWPTVGQRPIKLDHQGDTWLIARTQLQSDVHTLDLYAERFQDAIVRFGFVPPAVTASILKHVIPPALQSFVRASPEYPFEHDFAHEARIRTSIAFPDSRLLIYDSGKLQRLTHLLRDLQAKGSRSLIFTQMTGTLNILEQFLNLLNLPYLRLDGSTPVERRQLYCAEFNRPDSRYQCMILSSRAGGVGLNLTGASSVIFFDLDWNPQMDRQCMDRAHRIGQVRDVEVFKMVSEKTVEENILRRANQKSLLDQTVIQDGQFTTDFQRMRQQQQRPAPEGGDENVSAAIERFLGGGEQNTTQALESVEEAEDVQAAQQARKEDQQDDVDFAADAKATAGATEEEALDEDRKGHLDSYLVRFMQFWHKDTVYIPPPLAKHGKDVGKRAKRKR